MQAEPYNKQRRRPRTAGAALGLQPTRLHKNHLGMDGSKLELFAVTLGLERQPRAYGNRDRGRGSLARLEKTLKPVELATTEQRCGHRDTGRRRGQARAASSFLPSSSR